MRAGLALLMVLALMVLALPAPSHADVIERAQIVAIEENEIYFNLGSARKLAPRARVRFKRPIQLKHPVTAKLVTDWLPIGDAHVSLVGTQLSMARVAVSLRKQLRRGDLVEVLVARVETPVKPTPGPAPSQPMPAVPPETRAVLAVWQRTAGQSLQSRIVAWEAYLHQHPRSPYAAAVRDDLDRLRKYREQLQPRELRVDRVTVAGVRHNAPSRAGFRRPVDLVFLLERPDELITAWLHYRTRGTQTYRRKLLARHGQAYLRGRIPARSVVAPGVEYFVEVATRNGSVGAAVSDAREPQLVTVAQPRLASVLAERRHRSRITVSTTFLDFATFDGRSGVRTDQFMLMEADFFYRLRQRIYGVRVGYGSYNGRGGFANRDFTAEGEAPAAGFNYGYSEVELRASATTALMARVIAGVGREGFGMGIAGRLRVGREDGTNLSLGASTIAEIGFLSELRMQWNAVANIPLGLSVGVTDQPNRGDLGVRLGTSIGWRALPWFQPTLNISYQARTVVHSGIGAGLAMVFDW